MTGTRRPEIFTKRYQNPARCRAALEHHAWLAQLGANVPRVVVASGSHIDFVHVPGLHVTPTDVPLVAGQLGRLHGLAHASVLNAVRLDQSFGLPTGTRVAGFTAGRVEAMRARFAEGVPDPSTTARQAEELLESAADEPAAFYKDANPRNFLISEGITTLVDFDDLTLAPFGYDLAKLLVTTVMTHGPIAADVAAAALHAYNLGVEEHLPALTATTPDRIAQWMGIHHILTCRYAGTNGYRFRFTPCL